MQGCDAEFSHICHVYSWSKLKSCGRRPPKTAVATFEAFQAESSWTAGASKSARQLSATAPCINPRHFELGIPTLHVLVQPFISKQSKAKSSMPLRRPSSDAGAMEVSTGCHHTSNHSSTLGATSVAVPPSQAQKKQAKSTSTSNIKQRRNSASPRQNMHGQHVPAASRRPHVQNARGQFGFAVNGFHPQWSASSNLLLASRARDLTAIPISIYSGPPGSLNEQVATATNDLISRIRHDEEEKKNVRKRHLAEAAEAAAKVQRRREQASPKSEEFSADTSSSNTSTSSAASEQTRASFSSLYGDVFLKASSGQILVSPGGRILACKYNL